MRANFHGLLCLGLLVVFPLASCRKEEKVLVTEQRRLTIADDELDSLLAVMPSEWRRLPATQFRILNYRFGKDGEVFVGRSRGGVLPNVNRWLDQYGKPALETLDDLPKVSILGQQGVLITTSGDFKGGMGRPARQNAGLAGVIVGAGEQLLTVKMTGDAQGVLAEQERLIQFCENLRIKGNKSE
ncbi:MAG: hypothetical protein ACPH5P_01020 [Akkermansiaceae bacterium]